jgi:flagellar motor switch protein FliN
MADETTKPAASSTPGSPPEPAPDQNALDALAAVQAAIAAAGAMGGGAPAAAAADNDPVAAAMAEAMSQPAGHASHSVGASAAVAAAASTSNPAPFSLPNFATRTSAQLPEGINLLSDVNLNVKIELGRTRMLIEDVLKLTAGAVVELDKLAGDPVDVYVNNRPVARGEVLVLNDNFCVRINEILDSSLLDGQ